MDTLESMRMFARVVSDGGFTAAARHMNAHTGQISRAISHLEARLKTRLLNRTTRKLALTEAGERYLAHCHKILSDLDHAEAEAGDAQVSPTGTLRIHAMSSFGQHHVVPALLRFQGIYPSLKVDLTFSPSAPDLLDAGYDVSIVLAPSLPDSGLIGHRLGTVVGVACASPAYITRRGTPYDLADIGRHTCLQLTNPVLPSGKWMFVGETGPELIRLSEPIFSVNTSEALEVVLRQGLGIGILPVASALPGLKSGELVRVLSKYPVQSLNLYALYPSRQYVDAKIRLLIEFLRKDMPATLESDVAELQACSV